MNRKLVPFGLPILVLCVAAVAADRPSTTPVLGLDANDVGSVAFVNATIAISPGRTLEGARLLVRNGQVAAVGKRLDIPAGVVQHDLKGKMIYPGFIDPMTAYGLGEDEGPGRPAAPAVGGARRRPPPRYEADRVGGNAWNESIHAERNWVDSFEPDADAAKAFLERGVTTVQSARLDGIFRGRAFVASLATGLPNDLVLRSHASSFMSFDKGRSRQTYPSSLMGAIALIRQTLLDAAWYREARAALEADPNQPAPEFNRAVAAIAAIAASRDADDPIVFETGDLLSLLRAELIAEEFSLPLIHVGSNDEYSRIDAVRSLERPIILPVDFPSVPEVGSFESALDVSLASLRRWERAPWNAATLADQEVSFAFTSHGLEAGQDYLGQIRKTVARGLAPEVALAALTTVPAEMVGLSHRVGTLEPGKRADFFITDGDLFEKDTSIHEIWIAGRRAHEARPLDLVDFKGEYDLTLDATVYELAIKGKPGKPSGELRLGDKTAALTRVVSGRDSLRFAADLEALGGEGVARFTWIALGPTPDLQVTLPDGSRTTFEVEKVDRPGKDDPKQDDEKKGADKKQEDPRIVSRLTYPNIAFGLEKPERPRDVLVRNATVWTNEDDGVLQESDLLVRDGKIVGVGSDLKAPGDLLVIDGTGKHVTAGIIDEHSHIAMSRGGNEGSHAVTAEVRVGDIINSRDVGIYRALAGGVTAAQVLHGSANPIGGQAQVIKLRWGSDPEGLKFDAAPPTIKFALGENVKQSNAGDAYISRYPQTRMGVETLMRDRFLAARAYEAEWAAYEALGSKSGVIPPRRDLQLDALLEILNRERFIHCHSYVQSEILMLMRLAEELDFRVQTFTHILEGYKVASEMAAHGAGGSTFADWWAYKFEVFDAIPYNTCLMHDAGVVTSINSDSGNYIRRLNQEAAKSVLYCGMSEQDALKLATLNPAIQLKIDDRVGSLAPGKDGDFVIWNGHPLSMFSKAEQTWIDGALYFDIERDRELAAADRSERQSLIQKVLAAEEEQGKGGPGKRPGGRGGPHAR